MNDTEENAEKRRRLDSGETVLIVNSPKESTPQQVSAARAIHYIFLLTTGEHARHISLFLSSNGKW